MQPGPKQLKIKWEFMQLFSVPEDLFTLALCLPFSFIHAPSADLSIKASKENFQNAGNGCRKSHVILSCFMQPGPGLSTHARNPETCVYSQAMAAVKSTPKGKIRDTTAFQKM